MGFRELLRAGVLDRLPRIVGVQASACAPLYGAFHGKPAVAHQGAHQPTVAEGVAIRTPARGRQILDAIRATSGSIVAVSDQEIGEAVRLAARLGFYVEPTGAVGLAGLRTIMGSLHTQASVVTVFTGHGLKSPRALEELAAGSGTAPHAARNGERAPSP